MIDHDSNFSREVAASYRDCQAIACSSRSSFYWAFSLLGPARRRGMMALYAIARLIDDWGDSGNDLAMTAADWHAFIDHCEGNTSFKTPSLGFSTTEVSLGRVAPAVRDMLHRFSIPSRHLHEIVEGVASDRKKEVAIDTLGELEEYCHLVASSVGMACLSIWGGYCSVNVELARSSGLAFQFTNILRDIREDAINHRVYLPHAWFAEFGVDRQQWVQGKPVGNWKAMLMRLVHNAESQYQFGWKLSYQLEPDSRRMFCMIWQTYRALLEQIVRQMDSLWDEKKISLSRSKKMHLYLLHAFTPWFARTIASNASESFSMPKSPADAK